jgi:transcriptional regulator with XRE-family HTH domain
MVCVNTIVCGSIPFNHVYWCPAVLGHRMDLRSAFAESLKKIRSARQMTQEDFGDAAHRVYISFLERAKKSPTLDKIDELAAQLKVHPLTLLTLTYMQEGDSTFSQLQDVVRTELNVVAKKAGAPSPRSHGGRKRSKRR